MMKAIRVLLVDDHPLMRAGVRAQLVDAGVEFIGEASNGHEAIEQVEQARPHVVLMDIAMPGLNGIEATERIVKQFPRTSVIILSTYGGEQYVGRALKAGAKGYIQKDAEPAELRQALAAVTAGKTYLSPAVASLVVTGFVGDKAAETDPLEELTPRQREVLQLVGEGYKTKEIAKKLDISVRTVENHRAQIMKLLDIHDAVGLAHFALRTGLIQAKM